MSRTLPGLRSLFEAVQAEGIAVGPLELGRLRHVFAGEPELADEELFELLAAVLAKSPEQRALLKSELDRWLARAEDALVQPADGPVEPVVPERPERPPPEPKEPEAERRRYVGLALASIALVALVAWFFTPSPTPVVIPEPPPAPAPVVSGPTAVLEENYPSDPVPSFTSYRPSPIQVTPSAAPQRVPLGLNLLRAVAIASLGAMCWLVWRARKSPPPLPAVPGPSFAPPPRFELPRQALLTPSDRRTVVFGVEHFVEEEPSHALDLERTVSATARAGGLPEMRYQFATRPREVWLWLDEETRDPSAKRLQDELAWALEEAGLGVSRGYYSGTPLRITLENGERVSPLVLESHRAQAIVALLTDGAGLLAAQRSAERAPALREVLLALSDWPRLGVVDFSTDGRELAELLRRHGLACLSPAGLSAFLGADVRAPRTAAARAAPDELRFWKAALALGPDGFDPNAAWCARERLGLALPAVALGELVGDKRHALLTLGTRFALAPEERAEELTWLGQAEGFAPGRSEGLLGRATGFWLERYEEEERETRARATTGSPWLGTPAEQARALERALLRLWTHPVEAARELERLHRGALRERVRARLGEYRPADAPRVAEQPAIRLPWTLAELPEEARWQLVTAGLETGVARAETRTSSLAGVAIGLVLGVLLAVSVALGKDPVPEELPAPRFASVPPNPGLVQALEVLDDESWIALAASPTHTEWTLVSRGDVLSVAWTPLPDTPSTEDLPGGARIYYAGARPPLETARPAGWPARSLAVVDGDPADPADRQLALRLIDTGNADAVFLASFRPKTKGSGEQDVPSSPLETWSAAEEFLNTSRGMGQAIAVRRLGKGGIQPKPMQQLYSGFDTALQLAIEVPIDLTRRLGGAPGDAEIEQPSSIEVDQVLRTPKVRARRQWNSTAGLALLEIPAGEFEMGSKPGDPGEPFDDEFPQHRVVLANSFLLAETEVTRAAYLRVMGPERQAEWGPLVDAALPADVTWEEAVSFCNRWSELEGLKPCYEAKSFRLVPDANGYRLPSEAEWEYACRAGTRTLYWSGDDEQDLHEVGWYEANSQVPSKTLQDRGRPADVESESHRVGDKPANPFGLLDVHGNLFEWCGDTWHENYEGAPGDGSAWIDDSSERRVQRGGSFADDARGARSAFRFGGEPLGRFADDGFRPARSVSPPPPLTSSPPVRSEQQQK